MPGVRTNEVAGTRAVLRHYRMSAYKARQVLDMVRGQDVDRAEQLLHTTPREGARVVSKVLASAVANARNNDQLEREELYISACYADEGSTLKRWRPRARGRATRIRKRTCHITVIVSRLPEDLLERKRSRTQAATTALRSRRVAASRRDAARRAGAEAEAVSDEEPTTDVTALAEDEISPDEEIGPEEIGPAEAADEVDTAAPEEVADAVTEADEVAEPTIDQGAEPVTDEVAGPTSLEAEAPDDEAEPAPKPRRVRKSVKKAKAADEDPGDAAGSDENDKD